MDVDICLDMRKTEETRWGVFPLDELFDISSTQSSIDRNKLTGQPGLTPYITRTDRDNGIDDFIGNQPSNNVDEGNVITIGLDTQTVFYQPSKFYTGQNVQVLKNDNLNKYVALFIIPLIKVQMVKFNWGGNGATLGRLKKVTVKLPITDDEYPDYVFMEEYMKQMEQKLLIRYKNYIGKKSLKCQKGCGKMKDCRWKDFDVKEIFPIIIRGRRLKTDDHIKGTMPYVSSSAMDNGVDNFVSNNQGVRIFNNCLTIANSGSVGATFYHPYSFVASDHVTSLANEEFNKYVYLFGGNIASRLSEKYSFNREIKDSRLQREKIMLPVNDNDEPDYEYMEEYMRGIEYRLINRYINNRLKTLKAG